MMLMLKFMPPFVFMFRFMFVFRLALTGPDFGDRWKRGPSGDMRGDVVLLAEVDIADAPLADAAAIAISCVTRVFRFIAISSAHLSLPTPPPQSSTGARHGLTGGLIPLFTQYRPVGLKNPCWDWY